MKYKYKLHPNQYELGENEQFYSNMEAKGWRLVNRGAYWSKFEPVEPSHARYRVEIHRRDFLNEELPGLPEEQLIVFEDCGWEYVTNCGDLHIFRAPAGSDAPEFYTDPAQQAETLKKMKREAVWGWVPSILIWGLLLAMNIALSGSSKITGDFQRRFVEVPPLFFLAFFLLLEELYNRIRGAWLITRTYRRLKKGIPLDHNPRKNRWLHRAVCTVLWVLIAANGVLLAAQLIGVKSYDMPEEPDGPYYLIKDIGFEGVRTEFMGHESGVTHSRTLLADYWDTEEYIYIDETRSVFVTQDIYRLYNENMANWLAQALMKTAIFGAGGKNFEPIKTDAADAAWASHELEVVVVKGPYAAYVCQTGWSKKFDAQAICSALAARWD